MNWNADRQPWQLLPIQFYPIKKNEQIKPTI